MTFNRKRRHSAGGALVGAVAWPGAIWAALLVASVGAVPIDPAVKPLVDRAAQYLRGNWSAMRDGRDALAAYALLKAGEPPGSRLVQQAVATIRSRITADGVYEHAHHSANYIAGVNLMLLETIDPVEYRSEIAASAQFLIRNQLAGGYWEYPQSTDRGGDTSQLQYAILGLWAAYRAGYEVPTEVWDKAALFLISSQKPDGGYSYTPLRKPETTYSMTVAGLGTLAILRRMMYPAGDAAALRNAAPRPEPSRRFGVLEKVDTARVDDKLPAARSTGPYSAQASLTEINTAIDRALAWLEARYRTGGIAERQMYYLYGIERMAALLDLDRIAGHDWFAEGIDVLAGLQQTGGSWEAIHSGEQAATAWGILFLTRATSSILGRPRSLEAIGGGLLKGGRGLPSNLAEASIDDGQVKARPVTDPIEKLLAQLENQETARVEDVQTAIVETVQLGNREELIGQKDRLVTLTQSRQPEVRRTAIWALGHTDDLTLIKLMFAALRDADPAVRVEAHNALCTLSRKPNGFEGLANDPLDGVADDATEAQKQAAVDAWTKAVAAKWREWYLAVRPYDERDDLLEIQTRRGR